MQEYMAKEKLLPICGMLMLAQCIDGETETVLPREENVIPGAIRNKAFNLYIFGCNIRVGNALKEKASQKTLLAAEVKESASSSTRLLQKQRANSAIKS